MRRTVLPPAAIAVVHVHDEPQLPRYWAVSSAAKRIGLPGGGAELLSICEASGIDVLELRTGHGRKPRRLIAETDLIELLRTSRRRSAVENAERLDLALDLALEQVGAAPRRRRRSAS